MYNFTSTILELEYTNQLIRSKAVLLATGRSETNPAIMRQEVECLAGGGG